MGKKRKHVEVEVEEEQEQQVEDVQEVEQEVQYEEKGEQLAEDSQEEVDNVEEDEQEGEEQYEQTDAKLVEEPTKPQQHHSQTDSYRNNSSRNNYNANNSYNSNRNSYNGNNSRNNYNNNNNNNNYNNNRHIKFDEDTNNSGQPEQQFTHRPKKQTYKRIDVDPTRKYYQPEERESWGPNVKGKKFRKEKGKKKRCANTGARIDGSVRSVRLDL